MSATYQRRLSRVHQQLLGLTYLTGAEPEPVSLERIVIEPLAQLSLMQQLELKGSPQGGFVFGERLTDVLHIHAFTQYGPRSNQYSFSLGEWNADYILGYTDAILATHAGAVDWHGDWFATAIGEKLDLPEDIDLFQAGQAKGLFDDQHPFLSVGWNGGVLEVAAYCAHSLEIKSLPVTFPR